MIKIVSVVLLLLSLLSINNADSLNYNNSATSFETSGISYFYIPASVVDLSVKFTSQYSFAAPVTDTLASQKEIENAIQQVQSQVAQSSQNLIDYLNSNYSTVLSKLKTSNVQLNPTYTYSTTASKSLFTGYNAAVTVSFRLPISSSSNIMSNLVSKGVTEINSVSYSATDEEILNARLKAVELATNDAISQAQSMIKSFNSQLGSSSGSLYVIKSSVGYVTPPNGENSGGNYYALPPALASDSSGNNSPSTPLISGEMLIKATVNAVFGFK